MAGLEAAWAFFGGIPKYLVVDNFPAAVAGADALHPHLTRGFLEYSQHRGFITDPARVRRPKDKPKVERGVQYVRECTASTLMAQATSAPVPGSHDNSHAYSPKSSQHPHTGPLKCLLSETFLSPC